MGRRPLLGDRLLVWAVLLAVWITVIEIDVLAGLSGTTPSPVGLLLRITTLVLAWSGVLLWRQRRWTAAAVVYILVGASPWTFPFLPFASLVAALPLILGAIERRRQPAGQPE